MKFSPAKVLMTAAMLGLGLSGGVAMASYMPDVTSAVAAVVSGPSTNDANNGGAKTDYLSAAATYIGITTDQLRTELGTDKSLADVAVAHGKTRDGLIAALVAAQQQDIATLVDRKGIGARPNPANGPGPGFGRGPGGSKVTGDPEAAAAAYLGNTAADLETKLEAGQTLAQVANATAGKSRDGLIAALVNDAKAKIAAAQTAGTITAAQATNLTNALQDRMTRLVDAPEGGPRRSR